VQILTAVAQNFTAIAQVLTAFFGDVNYILAAPSDRADVARTYDHIDTHTTTLWPVSYTLQHCHHNRESTVDNG